MIDGSEMSEEATGTIVLGARPGYGLGIWPSQSKVDANQSGGVQMIGVRTILIGDHGMARRGLRRELRFETDLEVVGEANTAEAGLALAQDQRPDIVIMDVEMPVMDGVQAAERLHALAPDCVIILLTVRDSVETHERGKAAGARVVLEKGNPEVFRNTFHDLVQFVKVRNTQAWPETGAADAQ